MIDEYRIVGSPLFKTRKAAQEELKRRGLVEIPPVTRADAVASAH